MMFKIVTPPKILYYHVYEKTYERKNATHLEVTYVTPKNLRKIWNIITILYCNLHFQFLVNFIADSGKKN